MSDDQEMAKILSEILAEMKTLNKRVVKMEEYISLMKKDTESVDRTVGDIENSISNINDVVNSIEVSVSSISLESMNDL